jgi:hypothetical protein
MIYFKTIKIPDTSAELIERAIRSYTVKRNSYLDFLITAGEDYENKIFSGIEKADAFLLTRMRDKSDSYRGFRGRTKIFIRFRKDNGFTSYQIRFGFRTSIFICFLLTITVISLWHAFQGGGSSGFSFLLMVPDTLIAIIASVEIDLNQKLINKAIERTRNDDRLVSNIS